MVSNETFYPHPTAQGSHDWRLRPRLKVSPGRLLAVNPATGCREVHSGSRLFNYPSLAEACHNLAVHLLAEVRHVAVAPAQRMCVAA